MNFRILGPVAVADGGRELDLGGRKQRSLLALLLLERNAPVSTDRLRDALWGEQPPRTATKMVQVYVSRLRRLLGEDRIRTHGHGYSLRVEPGELDLERLQTLLERAADETPRRAAATLREALSLFAGEPLHDLAFEPWAPVEIARLEELRLEALEQRVEADLALGRHAGLVPELDALVRAQPLREGLRGQLMLSLYRSGRQAEALAAYQDIRRLLDEELGLEPGARLRGLERAILRHDPSLDPAPPDEQAQGHERPRAPARTGGDFVGRRHELAELIGGLEDAIAGRGRLFLISGEPGIGKSRLAEETAARARQQGAHVLIGRCWEAGGAPAYWPWVQSLRGYVRQTEPDVLRAELGAGAPAIAQMLPELRAILPELPEPAPLESEAARFRLFEATVDFLRNASRSRPIVIALDDLHAADTPSLLLLRFVVRELAAMHVLLLAAFRDVDPVPGQALTALLADVAREPAATRLSPPGLSESDVARYVERAASEIASPELAAALYAETEGNPLFVGESVRLLCLDGVPLESTGEVRLAMPQSVRDVIAVRLDRLSDACSEVLGHASVLGREFALDVLARMGELRGEDLLARLDEAARARIVSDVPGSPGRLRFEHVLFRDSLYEGLSPMRRIGLHRRAGEALAVLSADEPGLHLAELAHHWIAGCDFERGLDYARRAAQRALVLLAYEEAARLYQVALTALDRSHAGGDTLRCDLLLALGDAQSLAGQGPTARETFLQAAAVARNMRSPERLSRAALGYAGRDIWGPRAEGEATLVPLLREALAACPDGEDQLRARLLARLATSLRGALDRGQPASLADQAVEIASRVGDRSTLLTALGARLVATRGPENVAESVADARAVIELAEELGDPERAFGGHEDLSYSLWVLGDRSSMVAEVGEMTRLARELRQPAREWAVTAHHAMSALSAGQLAAAGELIETAFRLGEQSESWPAVASHRLQTFLLRELRGELRGYVDVLRDSLGEYPGYRIFECALAHACFELGREAEAREAFEHLAEDDFRRLSRDEDWLVNVCLLSDVCVYLGDAKRAAVLYRLVSPFAALNAVASAEIDLGAAARSVAGLAVALGRYDEAASHFDTALELNSRMGAWPWLAHTQHGYGRMLLLRDEPDDRSKARDLLAQALATYRELGLDRYVDRCLEPATRLGVSTGG